MPKKNTKEKLKNICLNYLKCLLMVWTIELDCIANKSISTSSIFLIGTYVKFSFIFVCFYESAFSQADFVFREFCEKKIQFDEISEFFFPLERIFYHSIKLIQNDHKKSNWKCAFEKRRTGKTLRNYSAIENNIEHKKFFVRFRFSYFLLWGRFGGTTVTLRSRKKTFLIITFSLKVIKSSLDVIV